MADLAAEIEKIMLSYDEKLRENMQKAESKVSKAAVKELKATSPNLTGRYAKDWTAKVNKKDISTTVYNRKNYQLTHLLEFGHIDRGGGRTKKFPHIKPVEEKYIGVFVNLAKRAAAGEEI